jgi:hypothetical protein
VLKLAMSTAVKFATLHINLTPKALQYGCLIFWKRLFTVEKKEDYTYANKSIRWIKYILEKSKIIATNKRNPLW